MVHLCCTPPPQNLTILDDSFRAILFLFPAEYLFVHALDYVLGMGFGEVGVPLDHLERLMRLDCCDLRNGGLVHGHVRGSGMSEVMETKVLDLRYLECFWLRPGRSENACSLFIEQNWMAVTLAHFSSA